MLVLHTDGITDARGARERFGEDRLRALLQQHGTVAPDMLLAELEAALDAFQVGPQADDTALIALRRQPIAPADDDTIRHRTSAAVAHSTRSPPTTRRRAG